MTAPSPQQLAAIAAAYAVLRAATPEPAPAPTARSRWAFAGRVDIGTDAPRAAHIASRWALAGRRDG